jgi:hypothetical protein
MDDLHWFFRGFYTKRVAGVQKLSEVGDMLTVIRSVLCIRRAETISVRTKIAAIKFEKSFVDPGGFWLSRRPGRVLVELPRPSALRTRLMHFPFEIIIWDTKVF